jgi:hypothetical protein
MPKHGADTQFKDADVETRSCHTVQKSAIHVAETDRELRC